MVNEVRRITDEYVDALIYKFWSRDVELFRGELDGVPLWVLTGEPPLPPTDPPLRRTLPPLPVPTTSARFSPLELIAEKSGVRCWFNAARSSFDAEKTKEKVSLLQPQCPNTDSKTQTT